MGAPKNSKKDEYSITEEDLRTVTIIFNGKKILGPAGMGLDPVGLEIWRRWEERHQPKEQGAQNTEGS